MVFTSLILFSSTVLISVAMQTKSPRVHSEAEANLQTEAHGNKSFFHAHFMTYIDGVQDWPAAKNSSQKAVGSPKKNKHMYPATGKHEVHDLPASKHHSKQSAEDHEKTKHSENRLVVGRSDNSTSTDTHGYSQCASEYSVPTEGCTTCTMNTTCACNGLVLYGYGTQWSSPLSVTDTIECTSAEFPEDPYPGHGKICMCRPTNRICASEYDNQAGNCPECTLQKTCTCNGDVRFGYGDDWSNYTPVLGSVECSSSVFGDPSPGQGKLCECTPDYNLTFTSAAMARVNTETYAITTITMTYLVVSGLVALLALRNNLYGLLPTASEGVLNAVLTSCMYSAPMLCTVILLVSKRTETLTAGNPAIFGLPPLYVACAVALSAAAFCAQTCFYYWGEQAVAQATAAASVGMPNAGGISAAQERQRVIRWVKFWRWLCNVSTALMYACVVVMFVGIVSMKEPDEVYEKIGATPISVGSICTLTLAVVYFAVYLALYLCKASAANSYVNGGPSTNFGAELSKLLSTTMNFAPMLCVLFMGTQIAADWEGTALANCNAGTVPAAWMYVATAAVITQVVITLWAALFGAFELRLGPDGKADFTTRNQSTFLWVSCFRWIALTVLYASIVVVCVSLWKLSVVPAMTRSLYWMTGTYFFAYLLLWFQVTTQQLLGKGFVGIEFKNNVKERGVFCPMLATLFLEMWIRARHVTNDEGQIGVPQGYVQDAMIITVACLSMQLFLVLFQGSLASNKSLLIFLYTMATLAIYVCSCIVIYGIFTVSSENATGEGAVFASYWS